MTNLRIITIELCRPGGRRTRDRRSAIDRRLDPHSLLRLAPAAGHHRGRLRDAAPRGARRGSPERTL